MAEPTEVSATLPIVLDLYEGAYGRTLRIDVRSGEGLVVIKGLFAPLSHAAVSEIRVVDGQEFRLTGFSELRLILGAPGRPGRRLRQIGSGDTCRLDWALDSAGWWEQVGLVEGLLRDGPPGHQYLSKEGLDDVLVELAYGE